MASQIRAKEATAIINSLSSGVVPRAGIQHITVGRELEIGAITKTLDDIKKGHSVVKFWIGDYGSGKSFMLHLLNTVAIKQKFVVTGADFTPDSWIYSNSNKSLKLYSSLIDNIAIQTKPEGGALPSLLDKWIEQETIKTAQIKSIPLSEIWEKKYHNHIQDNIFTTINEISDTGGFDFGMVVNKYFEGYINNNDDLKRCAIKWLKGEYRSKIEARHDLGVREIISDLNYYDMLKNFSKLFVGIGYNGLIVNLDEAGNLYKITNYSSRTKNYEKILAIFNDCYQGRVANLLINIAGTKEFLENERRGLYSYNALKTRLEKNRFETKEIRDFAQPVIKLSPLNHNEIFVLLKKLIEIFNINFSSRLVISDKDIKLFMEEIYNKPQADIFLTPREVIRDFINVLNIIRQNPKVDIKSLISKIEINDERPVDMGIDSIEEF